MPKTRACALHAIPPMYPVNHPSNGRMVGSQIKLCFNDIWLPGCCVCLCLMCRRRRRRQHKNNNRVWLPETWNLHDWHQNHNLAGRSSVVFAFAMPGTHTPSSSLSSQQHKHNIKIYDVWKFKFRIKFKLINNSYICKKNEEDARRAPPPRKYYKTKHQLSSQRAQYQFDPLAEKWWTLCFITTYYDVLWWCSRLNKRMNYYSAFGMKNEEFGEVQCIQW